MNNFHFLIVPSLILSLCACTTQTVEKFEALYEAPEFIFDNCLGESISKDDLIGHIWVVDFIFTRCGGPCPLMTQRMRSLQSLLIEEGLAAPASPVKLVSISVDPAYDTPEVLHEYAMNWKADLNSWYFLTGPPESTLRVIKQGFKIAAERDGATDAEMAEIIHSTHFLLVDQRGWIRKIYHLEEPDLERMIVEGIKVLGLEESERRSGVDGTVGDQAEVY